MSEQAGTDDGEEAGGEAGDEVLASTCADNGVVGAGDGGAVVGRHHQTHLNELAGVAGQSGGTAQCEEDFHHNYIYRMPFRGKLVTGPSTHNLYTQKTILLESNHFKKELFTRT